MTSRRVTVKLATGLDAFRADQDVFVEVLTEPLPTLPGFRRQFNREDAGRFARIAALSRAVTPAVPHGCIRRAP